MTTTDSRALPTLAILVAFDLGMPLKITEISRRRVSGMPACERLAVDKAIREAFGEGVVVSIRSEAARYLEMNLATEAESFPYGTTAVLGQCLRLRARSGKLIECWRNEAIAIMGTPWSKDFDEGTLSADALRICDFELTIDVFACGAACLRLLVWFDEPKPELVSSCASLLEYALYGDIRTSVTKTGRLDDTNRHLRAVRDAIVAQIADVAVASILNREKSLFRNGPDWMPLRWTANVLSVERSEQFDQAIAVVEPAGQQRGSTTGSLVNIKTAGLWFRDHPWMAVIFVTDPDTYYRVLYVLTVSEAISVLMIDLAQDLDEKLSSAMLLGDAAPFADRDLRDIRFFTQVICGLGSTWRISALDLDVAIADSRARDRQHDRYQNHLAAASETLYALESARLADSQRRRAEAVGFIAALVAGVTLWTLVLALKDVGEVWEKIRPHLSMPPREADDYLLDMVIGTGIAAICVCIVMFVRAFWRRKATR